MRTENALLAKSVYLYGYTSIQFLTNFRISYTLFSPCLILDNLVKNYHIPPYKNIVEAICHRLFYI